MTAASQAILSRNECFADEHFFRETGLKEAQVLRLFRAAIRDDDTLVDAIVDKLYLTMKAFDSERTHNTIELVVDRDLTARSKFWTLLEDVWPPRA